MFYVYVYRDPRLTKNQQPVYVGKGSETRAWRHWQIRNTNNKPFNDWRSHIRGLGMIPIIQVVAEFESEDEAFTKERELIELYGRRDLKTGPLFNSTSGGWGVTGRVWTPEHRANAGDAARNRNNASFRTPEFRARIGSYSKQNWQSSRECHKLLHPLCRTPKPLVTLKTSKQDSY